MRTLGPRWTRGFRDRPPLSNPGLPNPARNSNPFTEGTSDGAETSATNPADGSLTVSACDHTRLGLQLRPSISGTERRRDLLVHIPALLVLPPSRPNIP